MGDRVSKFALKLDPDKKDAMQVKEGLRTLYKLLSKKEVHYKMLSSGVWLPAKALLSSLQLRAFEASHHWVCLNCLGMQPRLPADVSAPLVQPAARATV